jgi:glutamate-5-semialdehyde dehydrogenase
MSDLSYQMIQMGQRAKQAAQRVAGLDATTRNQVLLAWADALLDRQTEILNANAKDLAQAQNLSGPMQKRLTLDAQALQDMATSLRAVADLPDPLQTPPDQWQTPNALDIQRVTVPLGVVAMVYEARPNVTVDAAALTFKAGNVVILRGGKEAIHSNIALANLLRDVLATFNLPSDVVQLITDTTHQSVAELLHMRDYIDVLIPRGSGGFIEYVVNNARVPVIETGAGNTHIFVDESADQAAALRIIQNAKTQKPAVCNAAEKLLVHAAIAEEFMPKVVAMLRQQAVELRGDDVVVALGNGEVQPASPEDWYEEYNDLIMGIRVVANVQEAIDWINQHTTHHSEAIISQEADHVAQFMNQVDAAVVYRNASTRFTDGFEFGFGAEIGISTQKLHARGPMGLPALTTIKYHVFGDGQIRD